MKRTGKGMGVLQRKLRQLLDPAVQPTNDDSDDCTTHNFWLLR